MARHQAALDFLRPLLDVGHAAEFAAALGALRLAAPHRLGLAQIGQQLAPQFATRQGIERGVDRLVRHQKARSLFHSVLDPLASAAHL